MILQFVCSSTKPDASRDSQSNTVFTGWSTLNRSNMFAIAREKEIKHWTRLRRVQLIELDNPVWDDLAASWFSDQLLADPNAPAVIDYDPTMAARKRDYVFNNASPEQPVRIKFRFSRTQRFEERKD
jgi:hypothetical protein